MITRAALLSGMAVCSTVGAGALGFITWQQHTQIQTLLEERNYFLLETASTTKILAETTQSASTTISDLTGQLTAAQLEIAAMSTDLKREEDRNQEFAKQLSDLTGTVGDLTTLATIDEELLQKYSTVFFLSEHYVPAALTKIPNDYVDTARTEQYFLREAWPFLEDMLQAAAKEGLDLKVASAYRSFEQQAELKGLYTRTYGSGANAFSADQGYSEHQLGTAVDLVSTKSNNLTEAFADTPEYAWLVNNAHKYGFIMSYPKGNQYYIFEPWHWRFVGTDLARDLARADAHFYDWDQRKINEYLLELFD